MITVVGTGYTGARILRLEADASGISRSLPVDVDPARITLVDLDGSNAPPLETGDAVIYTVAPTATPGDTRLALFLSALALPPRRFVYISTTGVYGDREGTTVNEEDEPAPRTERAIRRLEAEKVLQRWADSTGVSLVILRVPGIYGPGRLGLDRIRSGDPLIREEDANPGNRIHVDDLVQCCVQAASHETPAGIYNVGDGDTRSSTWFAGEVARQAGLEPPSTISRADAEATFPERRLSFLRESRIVDISLMLTILGVKPRSPEEGIQDSL